MGRLNLVGGLMIEEPVIAEKEESTLSDEQREVEVKSKDKPKLDSKIMIFNTKEK
jgi:hypothetical protein